jgi:hypothetical protein
MQVRLFEKLNSACGPIRSGSPGRADPGWGNFPLSDQNKPKTGPQPSYDAIQIMIGMRF